MISAIPIFAGQISLRVANDVANLGTMGKQMCSCSCMRDEDGNKLPMPLAS